jgi:Protein of unknown function (DUF2786)
MSELQKVKEKIWSLNAKTVANGCTEEEALSAMNMVGKLLEQYNLSIDEVSLKEDGCVCIAIDLGAKRSSPITHVIVGIADLTGTTTWQGQLWGKCAELCGVKDWSRGKTFVPGRGFVTSLKNENRHLFFFGTPTDVEAARHLWNVIMAAEATEVAAYKRSDGYVNFYHTLLPVRGNRRSLLSSFSHGMSDRLNDRLAILAREGRKNVKEEEEARRQKEAIPTGTSLVVLKKQLVEQEWRKTGIKLSTGSSSGASNGDAYHAGAAAAGRVNLGRQTALIGSR